MVTISYDGGNHPEYASNVYSQVHRIYIKDNKLLFDIDDECGYSEDRITTYELFNIASYIYCFYKNNILMEINLSTKEIENLLDCLEVITGAIKLIDDGNKKYVVDCFNEVKLCISE